MYYSQILTSFFEYQGGGPCAARRRGAQDNLSKLAYDKSLLPACLLGRLPAHLRMEEEGCCGGSAENSGSGCRTFHEKVNRPMGPGW